MNRQVAAAHALIWGLLGIVFITLKLLGVSQVAGWAWLWVLAPFWIPTAVILTWLLVWIILRVLLGELR